jgi:hypothetical protein
LANVLDEIAALDPARDCQRITFLVTCRAFAFDTTRALELALFRTFCSPRISALLDRTGEMPLRAQKRYEDTDIIVSELMEYGYDSERGRRALRRMNQLHGRFQIDNQEFLYVLSSFIYEPIRWNERFGCRRMSEKERLGLFHFWREVGRRMGIHDIPRDYDVFDRFNREYEIRHFHYADSNQRVGRATVEMMAGWFPRPLRPLVRQGLYSIMDQPLLEAFGFPRPNRLVKALTIGGLRLRAVALRFWPERKRPRMRTEMRRSTYPEGYEIEKLGPLGDPVEQPAQKESTKSL